jgi:hypothetical protein
MHANFLDVGGTKSATLACSLMRISNRNLTFLKKKMFLIIAILESENRVEGRG